MQTVKLIENVEAPIIDELVSHHVSSNQAEGKSPKTIARYREMLTQFCAFLMANQYQSYLPAFNIDTVREYILYLPQKPKFKGHPYTTG